MTETTEEKKEVEAIIQSLEGENNNFKRMAQIIEGLINYSEQLEEQVTSLTKERDELKHDLGGEIYALQNENNVLKAQVEDLNYRAEEDERTIISHEKEMDALDSQAKCALVEIRSLKSQLSNREKEIEELKQNVRNFINEGEGYCPDCLSKAFKSKLSQ